MSEHRGFASVTDDWGQCEIMDHSERFASCERVALVVMQDRPTRTWVAACQIHALRLLEGARESSMGQFGEASDGGSSP